MDKVNTGSARLAPEDFAPARSAGWTDEALYFAITVCALFNFYNRWIDATGVHDMPASAYALTGKRLAERGYSLL